MIKKALTISAVVLLASAVSKNIIPVAQAKVQKCQDAQGKWHYGNDLRKVCKDEAGIKSVKERVKTPSGANNGSTSDENLARLELKVLNETQYLVSDLKTILAPYETEQDIESRFSRLRTTTSSEISKKEVLLEGLQKKQQILEAEKSTNPEKSKVLIADNEARIKSTEADIQQLNVKLEQIEQRQTKVISLFKEFKDKLDNQQATQQG